MDFGFGTFLEKFEEHFGKWPLRILLLLFGLAAALFCAKMIWDIGLGPIARSIWDPGFGDSLVFAAWSGIAWLLGFAVAGWMANRYARWRKARTLKEMLDRTEALDAEMQAAHHADAQKVDQLMKRVEHMLSELEQKKEELNRRLAQGDREA